jgi:hypothetical protein
MNEFELKEKNTRYPSIDGRIGLQIGVVDHTFDVFCIDFHGKVDDAKDKDAYGAKRAE